MSERTDVVVVGGSLAGCATAVLLARHGARVTVLEKASDPAHYKRMCTHYIQEPGVRALERLGLGDAAWAAGALPNPFRSWTPWGWIGVDAPAGLSLRREKLDPMLRALAVDEPGVDVRLGVTVTEVTRGAGGRVAGVRGRTVDGSPVEVAAQVVVGADGRASHVARAARVPGRVLPHGRIGYFGYFRNVETQDGLSLLWLRDPDANYIFPNDDGLTVVACFVAPDRLPEFRADPLAGLLASFDGIPGVPDLGVAELVGKVMGKLDMPNVRRPAARPGLAFVGDAVLAADPLWGVGVGLALQSAEMLADALGPAIASGADPDAALTRYQRAHRRMFLGHHLMMSDYATGRPFNPLERLIFSTATWHRPTAEMMAEIGARGRPLQSVITPPRLARTVAAATQRRLASVS